MNKNEISIIILNDSLYVLLSKNENFKFTFSINSIEQYQKF